MKVDDGNTEGSSSPVTDEQTESRQQPLPAGRNILRNAAGILVIIVILIGWAAIRESKGTFWLFEDESKPTDTVYHTYTDPGHTFSVDIPTSFTVTEHFKDVPMEEGAVMKVRIYTAESRQHRHGFTVSCYEVNGIESPGDLAEERLSAVITGMGATLSNTKSIERLGCTAIRGSGEGKKNGQPIQIITEICVKGKRVFSLTTLSVNTRDKLAHQDGVDHFFATFKPLN